jgi:hypothetical protein
MSILENKKQNRGGYRPNAKRPLKYTVETVILGTKVIPKCESENIKKVIDEICKPYLAKK